MTLPDSNPDKRPDRCPGCGWLVVDCVCIRRTKPLPRPDYDPHQDHPERFTEGPI